MKDAELRKAFRSADTVSDNAFVLLQEVAYRLNDTPRRNVGVEMVMRAVEHREAFGELEEVLDAMIRSVGLFPYANDERLSLQDRIAYEYHRPQPDSPIIFHRLQAEVYRRLVDGESLILSAPTSFGKSRLIDDVVSRRAYDNVAIVVPTLALIDETRRRVTARFKTAYKVVTHHSQEYGDKNIFVMTPERIVGYEDLPSIDFFVIDEFYKVGAASDADDKRAVTLNHAFYRLQKMGGQFYLLGPNIQEIPQSVEGNLTCSFIKTDYSTVVTERRRVRPRDDEDLEDALVRLAQRLTEPTLIYCASPSRATRVARRLVEEDVCEGFEGPSDSAAWIGENYSNDWVLPAALRCGIGVHHGRVPRALGQYCVRAFNDGALKFLICTSSLIEGVNTTAKNVIVYDKKVSSRNFDYFTFNNISGRSGRMFKHFVGRVYLFHDPPERSLPFVDFPFVTQDRAPASLLVQLDEGDLTERGESVVSDVLDEGILPTEIIRQNASIDPAGQVLLAKHIGEKFQDQTPLLAWTGFPSYAQLKNACELIWNFLAGDRPQRQGVTSASQLAFKVNKLSDRKDYPTKIEEELDGNRVTSVDQAIDLVLDFERSWATFSFPELLMALHRIQEHVLGEREETQGDYSFFAGKVESLYRNPVVVHLDEFGLPLPMLDKIAHLFPDNASLDDALGVVRQLDAAEQGLEPFEAELLEHCKEGL